MSYQELVGQNVSRQWRRLLPLLDVIENILGNVGGCNHK